MSKVNRTVLHETVPTYSSFNKGGFVRVLNDLFIDGASRLYQYVGSEPLPKEVPAGTVLTASEIKTNRNPTGSWLCVGGVVSCTNQYGYREVDSIVSDERDVVLYNGMYYKSLSETFPVTDLSDFENRSKWVNLGYLNGQPITDAGNFSADGKKLTNDEFRLLVHAANHLNLDVSNLGRLPAKLEGTTDIAIYNGFVFNGATIDASEYKGILNFTRRDSDITIHGTGSPVIDAINSGDFIGDQIVGLRGNKVLNDSFLIFETNQPYYKFRNKIENRREFNYLIRDGFLESSTKYPIPKNTITSIIQHKASKSIIPIGGFDYYLGSNEHNHGVQISNSKVLFTNVNFSMDDYAYQTSNPTLLFINRCDHFVGDNVVFQHATRSNNSTGFTYNIALSESFDVKLINFKGVGDGWGSTGSNHCTRVTFDGCKLSRIDFHNPVYDYLKVIDCDIGNWGILATTIGDLIVERTTFVYETYQYRSNLGIIRSRGDMGGWCDGDLIMRDVTIKMPRAINGTMLRGDRSAEGGVVAGSPLKFTFFNNVDIKGLYLMGIGTMETAVTLQGASTDLTIPSTITIDGMVSEGIRTVFLLDLDSMKPNTEKKPHTHNLVVNLSKAQFSSVVIVNNTSNLFYTKLIANGTSSLDKNEGAATKFEIPFEGEADLIGCDFGHLDFYYGTTPKKRLNVNVYGGRMFHEARSENPNNIVNGLAVGLTRVSFFGTKIVSHTASAMYDVLGCHTHSCMFQTYSDAGGYVNLRLPVVGAFSGGKASLLSTKVNTEQSYTLELGYDSDGTFQPITVQVPATGRSYVYYYRGNQLTITREPNNVVSVTGVGAAPTGMYVSECKY